MISMKRKSRTGFRRKTLLALLLHKLKHRFVSDVWSLSICLQVKFFSKYYFNQSKNMVSMPNTLYILSIIYQIDILKRWTVNIKSSFIKLPSSTKFLFQDDVPMSKSKMNVIESIWTNKQCSANCNGLMNFWFSCSIVVLIFCI